MKENKIKNIAANMFLVGTIALSAANEAAAQEPGNRERNLRPPVPAEVDSSEITQNLISSPEMSEATKTAVSNLVQIRHEEVVEAGYTDYEDYLDNRKWMDANEALGNHLALRVATINGIVHLLTSDDFAPIRDNFELQTWEDVVAYVDVYTALNEFGIYDAQGVGVEKKGDSREFTDENTNESILNRSLLEFKLSQLVRMKQISVDHVRENHGSDRRYVNREDELTDLGKTEGLIVFGEYYEPIRDLDQDQGYFYTDQLYSNLKNRFLNTPQSYVKTISEWMVQFNSETRLGKYFGEMEEHRSMHNWDFAIVSANYNSHFYTAIKNSIENGTVLPANVYFVQELGEESYSVFGDIGWSTGDPGVKSATGRTFTRQFDDLVNYYAGGWMGVDKEN